MAVETITGGCLCGRVRYESSGAPLFGVVCHCRDCQRASGAGHVPVMGVWKSTLSVNGETSSHAVVGGSGKLAVRHFCPNCGSTQFTRDRPDWGRLALRIAEYETAGVVLLERT